LALAVGDAAPRSARRSTAALAGAYLGLMAVVIAGAAGAPVGPARMPAGIVVGLVAPGWLLLAATAADRLGRGHTAALAVPLSLAVCALSGTVLTLAGVKLEALPLTLVVCAASLAALVAALARRPVPRSPPARLPALEPPRLTARTALAGALALAIVAMAASTVHQVVRDDHAARASTAYVALTGRLERQRPAGRAVRARVSFTAINAQPRAIRPRLEISVLPGAAVPLRRRLPVAAHAQASVRRSLLVRCGDQVVASLGGDGVPPRTSTLRIACPS
jgi:hypothetical protein